MDCDPTALPTQAILDAIESLQKKVDSVCKRPRSDEEQPHDVAFKHEGNRQQYLFTGVIDKHIGHALAALEELDVPAVLGHLTQARTAIATRQKHIRLADRSALGWATVSEYVEDELADDSGDEKRIKKVIRFCFPVRFLICLNGFLFSCVCLLMISRYRRGVMFTAFKLSY